MSSERRIDPATGREPDDPRHSNDELAGDMGVSSEREGPTGPGQHGTDGVRYTGPGEAPGDDPPEVAAKKAIACAVLENFDRRVLANNPAVKEA